MSSSDRRLSIIMRDGLPPAQAVGKPPHPGKEHEIRRENGLRIERNIAVAMRDGIHILVDVYRPDGPAGNHALPLLIGWSPYGKHNQKATLWPAADVRAGWISPYTAFEAPDPAYWCPRGFAILYPDPRGTWFSEGEMSHGGGVESRDCYDLIEWAGSEDWCNGKVGMTGVSYLTAIQWQVAPLKPPHLAAINPWEGFTDWYREFGYHGGIRETHFIPRSCGGLNWSTTRTEDTLANMLAHPLYDAYWQSKEHDLEAIETPALIVASWSDQGLHTRGTLEAFKRIRSREKWLEVHGQKKWHNYYRPESVAKQRAFFEHFLIRKDQTVPAWPKVNLEIRERCGLGKFRAEREWPLARTIYTQLYLDARDRSLRPEPVSVEATLQYDTDQPEEQAEFTHVFSEDTELTGHMKLRLWVETPTETDMDLFVAIQKYDRGGNYVPFIWYAMYEDGPVALGWLRASHRALDESRSTDWQPVHRHTREDWLQPGVPVVVDIEIWPSATLFRRSEQLRIVIKGRDIYQEAPETQPFLMHQDTRNRGMHIIHTGGCYDSHLLVPVIPPAKEPQP